MNINWRIPPVRVPVAVTAKLGMPPFRRLNETVILEAAYYRIRYLPQSTVWKVRHRTDRIRLVAWRMKNVDLPYWKKTHPR